MKPTPSPGLTSSAHSRNRCLLALALLLATACAAQAPPRLPARPVAGSIDALIGDAACESDAQCKTIGIGAKACGGPDAYRAWSIARTDAIALEQAAAEHAAERRKQIAARGEMSTCSVVRDPGAFCAPAAATPPGASSVVTGTCRLRDSRTALVR
jgi:hypothetical protein